MATIDYKEKYEQALERARQFSEKPYLEDSAGIVEYIFPELKESEGEKIRKVQLDYWRSVGGKEWHGVPVQETITWLERQGSQTHAWCEEDERMRQYVVNELRFVKELVNDPNYAVNVEGVEKEIDWMESLKDRINWKPSDEQMDALQYVCRNLNPPLSDKLGWDSIKTLESMYHDLKKLREE